MTYIHGKPSILHKLAFEVRYRLGLAYLDRCGKVLGKIVRDQPEWVIRGDQITSTGASLVNVRDGSAFKFGPLSCALSLEKLPADGGASYDDVQRFSKGADLLFATVRDELSLKDFSRIGFRVSHMFASDSLEDAENWVLQLGLFHANPKLAKVFGGALEAGAAVMVYSAEQCKLRITVNTVERSTLVDMGESTIAMQPRHLSRDQASVLREEIAKKKKQNENPEFAGVIEIDAYLDDPIRPEPLEFIEQAYNLAPLDKIKGLAAHSTQSEQ